MQALESWKRSPNEYTGKEMGTAEDNTYVYIAGFSVDQGKMTEELAQRAAVQALPDCTMDMMRSNGSSWW